MKILRLSTDPMMSNSLNRGVDLNIWGVMEEWDAFNILRTSNSIGRD